MKHLVISAFLFLLLLNPISGYSQIGGLNRESIFITDKKLEAAIQWTYDSNHYVVSYTNLPTEKFDYIVPTNGAGGNHAILRPMQVYKNINGDWYPASIPFFESMSFGSSYIDYSTTRKEFGGSGIVKDFGNGYILVSQWVRVKVLNVLNYYPVFLILKRETRKEFFDWDIILQFIYDGKSKNTVTDIKMKDHNTCEIKMSDGSILNLFFNRDKYEVWVEDSDGFFMGSTTN